MSLSAEGLSAGAGMVHLAPDQLERYRAAVDDERTGPVLEAAVGVIRAKGHECGAHEALETAARGYRKGHPRIELLRAKGIIMWHQWEPAPWLATGSTKDRVAAPSATPPPCASG